MHDKRGRNEEERKPIEEERTPIEEEGKPIEEEGEFGGHIDESIAIVGPETAMEDGLAQVLEVCRRGHVCAPCIETKWPPNHPAKLDLEPILAELRGFMKGVFQFDAELAEPGADPVAATERLGEHYLEFYDRVDAAAPAAAIAAAPALLGTELLTANLGVRADHGVARPQLPGSDLGDHPASAASDRGARGGGQRRPEPRGAAARQEPEEAPAGPARRRQPHLPHAGSDGPAQHPAAAADDPARRTDGGTLPARPAGHPAVRAGDRGADAGRRGRWCCRGRRRRCRGRHRRGERALVRLPDPGRVRPRLPDRIGNIQIGDQTIHEWLGDCFYWLFFAPSSDCTASYALFQEGYSRARAARREGNDAAEAAGLAVAILGMRRYLEDECEESTGVYQRTLDRMERRLRELTGG